MSMTRLRLEMQAKRRELARARRRLKTQLLVGCEAGPAWIAAGGGSRQVADILEMERMRRSLKFSLDLIADGGSHCDDAITHWVRLARLTPRELHVVRGRMRGESCKEVGTALRLPANQIGRYWARGLDKLLKAVEGSRLSPQQREILRRSRRGETRRSIAEALGIDVRQVDTQMRRIESRESVAGKGKQNPS